MTVTRVDVGSMFASDDGGPNMPTDGDDPFKAPDDTTDTGMDSVSDINPTKRLPDMTFESDEDESDDDDAGIIQKRLRDDMVTKVSEARMAASVYQDFLGVTKKRRSPKKNRKNKKNKSASVGSAYQQALTDAVSAKTEAATKEQVEMSGATTNRRLAEVRNETGVDKAKTTEKESSIKNDIALGRAKTQDEIRAQRASTDDATKRNSLVTQNMADMYKAQRNRAAADPAPAKKKDGGSPRPPARKIKRANPDKFRDIAPVERAMIEAQDDAMVQRTKTATEDDVAISKENTLRAKTKIRDEMETDKKEAVKHARREENQTELEHSTTQDEIASRAAETEAKIKLTAAERDARIAKMEAETRRTNAEVQFHQDLINEARRSVTSAINHQDASSDSCESSSEDEDGPSEEEDELPEDMMLTMKRPAAYDSDVDSVSSDVLEYQALLNSFETLSDSDMSDLSDMSDGALEREEQHLTQLLRELDMYEKKSQPQP